MLAEPSVRVLEEVVRRTLEEAAFIFAEESQDPPHFDGAVIVASLGYAGPAVGEIQLAATPSFAAMLAANLLGTEPEDPQAVNRSLDGLGELLNMIGGALVAEMFGAQTNCRLGLPVVKRVSGDEYERRIARSTCRVSLVEEAGQRIDAGLLAAAAGGAEDS